MGPTAISLLKLLSWIATERGTVYLAACWPLAGTGRILFPGWGRDVIPGRAYARGILRTGPGHRPPGRSGRIPIRKGGSSPVFEHVGAFNQLCLVFGHLFPDLFNHAGMLAGDIVFLGRICIQVK